jgi:riboflavin kinase / FMN adenylyltransferase
LKIHNGIENPINVTNAVVTIGTFDGVHIGHQKIIARLKEVATQHGGETVLITLYPHPRMVLFPDDNDLQLLSTQDEKTDLLSKYGIDHLVVIPFSKEFARLTSLEFVRDILVDKIGVKTLVIGYDHHFGRNREGSIEQLRELAPQFHFEVEEIPAQDIDHVNVSSTKIREALLNGEVETAKQYLGHAYSLQGTVVEGNKLGRTIGYPTANIEIGDKHKLIPADGVYAVHVLLGNERFGGMLNIGYRPTVDGKKRTTEVNIFDFERDLYGQQLKIEFEARLRNEQKFNGLDALKEQLAQDKINALAALK